MPSERCTLRERSSSRIRGTPGSARVLAALGFKALATTSSGFAFTLGRRDGRATLEEVIEHAAALDRATDLPVSVDLENGYGPDPDDAAEAIQRIAEVGAVGGSIEDYDPSGRIYDLTARSGESCCGVGGRARPGVPIHADGAGGESHPRQPGSEEHDYPTAGIR